MIAFALGFYINTLPHYVVPCHAYINRYYMMNEIVLLIVQGGTINCGLLITGPVPPLSEGCEGED
jgi:hypothetical protein